MKTDDLFYQIFQTAPELAFELMGQIPPCDYEFRAQEVKAFGFRTDGLMFPRVENSSAPMILLEAQMQPDQELYYRILNELTTYLRQYQPRNPWRVIVLYPRRSVERVVPHLESILAFCNLYRFYLNELSDGVSLGQDILRLMVTSQPEAEVKARELLKRVQQELSNPLDQNNFVELVLETVTRIFPQQSKEEIRKMLELVPVNQTRFYREVQEEEARSLVLRLLKRRVGELPNQAEAQIEQLNLAQTEALAEDLLDFTTLDDLFTWLQQQSCAEL